MEKTQRHKGTESWPMVRLGDVCEFRRGLTYSKADEVSESRNVVLRSNNVSLELSTLDFSELKHIRNSFVIPREKKVVAGSILMCMANGSKTHLGKVALIDKDYDYAFGGFMGLLVPKKEIDSRYLFSALVSPQFKKLIGSLMDGANINNLKFSDISDFTFPLPPLSVQREIVGRLEKELGKADELVAKSKRLGVLADELFKSELDAAFKNVKGEKVRLGDVCEVLDYKRKPITKKDRIAGEIPYYGATGIVDHVRDWLFDERLVLLGEDGAKWGAGDNSAFIIEGKTWVNNHAHVLRPCKSLFDKFLVYFLNLSDLNDFITGVTVPKLNQERMCSIILPLPPLAVQREIVARLDAARERSEKLKAAAERGAALAAELRKSILQEAFA